MDVTSVDSTDTSTPHEQHAIHFERVDVR